MQDQLMAFIQERWWVILVAAIALFVIVNLVKTVLKWVLIIAIVGAVVLYGANYKDELSAIGDQVASQAKDQAMQAIVGQALNAEYEAHEDGTFAVFTDSVRVEGKSGDSEVTVYWKGVKIGSFPIDQAIESFIEQAKNNNP
jgi:hypothetical protein